MTKINYLHFPHFVEYIIRSKCEKCSLAVHPKFKEYHRCGYVNCPVCKIAITHSEYWSHIRSDLILKNSYIVQKYDRENYLGAESLEPKPDSQRGFRSTESIRLRCKIPEISQQKIAGRKPDFLGQAILKTQARTEVQPYW
jgi:hypothetical protein